MSFRTVVKNSQCLKTTFKFLDVELNEKNGIVTVTMNRPPVNSLNLEMLKELHFVFNDLEQNKVKGMILASSSDKVYTAGLDLKELYKTNRERLTDYWRSLQDMWIPLYNSSFPTAALITGHAPAGGCLLALCCEYRVMLNSFTIGLNETHVGLPVPRWVGLSMENVIGRRNADLALTSGKTFTTEEALKVGLVDEIASTKADALEKVDMFFKSFENVFPSARAITKQDRREQDLKVMAEIREKELDFMVNYIMAPEFQEQIERYFPKLKTS